MGCKNVRISLEVFPSAESFAEPTADRPQGRYRLQVAEKQRACNKRHITIIERDLRLVAIKEFICRTFGNEQKGVDLVFLYGFASIVHIGIMANDMRRLEAVELPNHGAAHMGIVLIDNTYRHLYRLSSVHQRSEKEHYYKGKTKVQNPKIGCRHIMTSSRTKMW